MKTTHISPVASGLRSKRNPAAAQTKTTNVGRYANDWLSDWLPKKVCLSKGSLDSLPQYFEAGQDYMNHNEAGADADKLAVTLAEKFVRAGGHVIWIGTTRDLYRMSEQLMFKIAGLDLPANGAEVQLDVFEYVNLVDARAEMMNMWIDFCNVEDCGDLNLEHEFITSMSSFKPTLIVVDASIFDDTALDLFAALVRQTYGRHMVEKLRSTNPTSSVLWPSTAHDI